MQPTKLPWNREKTWPQLRERDAELTEPFEVPEWASRLAGLGHWMVTSAADRQFHRSVVIVPVRNTATVWVALGSLMASLATSEANVIEVGATVWFAPPPTQSKFQKGKVGSPIQDGDGLFRVERSAGRSNALIHSCSRDSFFSVENRPSTDSVRDAKTMVEIANRLGLQCSPDNCLSLEDAIQIAGSKERIQAAASSICIDGVAVDRLLMLDEGNNFSTCRHLGERRARPAEKARLVIIDGPGGLNILEDDSFKTANTPAVAILTPDEWISGQPDSDRIANALGDWGEPCAEWPEDLEMPGIGCFIHRKEARR